MARIFVQVSAIKFTWIAERSRKCQRNFRASERNQVYLKWRANERRAELVRAMPSAADIMKLPSAAENVKEKRLLKTNYYSQLLLSAKHVFVSNNTVFGERQAPS